METKMVQVCCDPVQFFERPMTEEELLGEKQMQDYAAQVQLEKAEIQAKRQALLDKLGITEEEAKLLLG